MGGGSLDVRDSESQEGVQRLRSWAADGKKDRLDHHRHREAVDVEIVELDGGADEAGEGDAGGGGVFHIKLLAIPLC